MKTLLFGSLLVLATLSNVSAATSNDSLNACVKTKLQSVITNFKPESKENLKAVTTGIRECRQSVAAQVKAEREAKKTANKAKRIEKLKAQLAKLQG